MGQLSAVLRSFAPDRKGFFCPGCREEHVVGPGWAFDGNLEKPTFSPSILVTGKETEKDAEGRWIGEWVRNPDGSAKDQRCHSFVREGRIEFLADCTHTMAGQTVDLPPLPDWLRYLQDT